MQIILDSKVNNEAVKYTFRTLFVEFLDMKISFSDDLSQIGKNESKDITFYYGFKENQKGDFDVSIYANDLWLKKNYLKSESMPKLPLLRYDNDLPIIYLGKNETKPDIIINDKSITTTIDFIASSFFYLSRYEEVISKEIDEHSNFPVEASINFKENLLHRPIVNEYLELLWVLLKKINPELKRTKRKFSLLLTHDVDDLNRWDFKNRMRTLGGSLFKRKSLKLFFIYIFRNLIWMFKSKKNPFKYIIYTSKKYGFKSHFYFLINGSSKKYDNRFDPQSKQAKRIIDDLENEGFEIGLHPSYSSFLNLVQKQKEKSILDSLTKQKVTGARTHYLRFKVPESYRNLESCGIKYDTSLGYSNTDGFRAGVCYPFKPFDILENKELSIEERPLITMEVALLQAHTYFVSQEYLFQLIKKRIDTISLYNGMFVFLMHNDSLSDYEYPWRKLYDKVLAYCAEVEGRKI